MLSVELRHGFVAGVHGFSVWVANSSLTRKESFLSSELAVLPSSCSSLYPSWHYMLIGIKYAGWLFPKVFWNLFWNLFWGVFENFSWDSLEGDSISRTFPISYEWTISCASQLIDRVAFTLLHSIRIDDEGHQHVVIQSAWTRVTLDSKRVVQRAFPCRVPNEFYRYCSTRNTTEVFCEDGFHWRPRHDPYILSEYFRWSNPVHGTSC